MSADPGRRVGFYLTGGADRLDHVDELTTGDARALAREALGQLRNLSGALGLLAPTGSAARGWIEELWDATRRDGSTVLLDDVVGYLREALAGERSPVHGQRYDDPR